ncbi:ATP-dependent DNA helicase pcrA [Candidatus Hepatoplasma crinochetorum Av]|uniref:DNA 3'-5' helicase n=1 Tax=Candidatus Hepatoplasma crinochetorum Av TaxID=1427984 RepID=W8GF00_9MOLU|nr:UvrD-helicase domain-containing protein [Candidatus Hepatoplasma crinochetorum]AHK22178.1 ATP-dependent DNA helicase pcrA [Candidatus Hepatoplasma crinochetorum Av]
MDLNQKQQEIVNYLEGPLRVIAGPGSGKTRTIIAKIEYLIKVKKINPKKILVVTFTNKAANEITERIKNLIGIDNFNSVYTYHSFAFHFLRLEANSLNLSNNYFILDGQDQKSLIKKHFKDEEFIANNSIDLNDLINIFHKLRFNPEEKISNDNQYLRKIAKLFDKYQNYKKEISALDFDDLIIFSKEILEKNEEIRNKWRKKYEYILVDEFQDIDSYQYQILKSITNINSKIMIVGDPDQNIYSWRGANIDLIFLFEKDYKNVKTIILNTNYRSTKSILKIANNLISNNKKRVSFDNNPFNKEDKKINLIIGKSKELEAKKVIDEIIFLHREKNIPLEEIAIIYRSNYISREYEIELINRGINYIVVGGFRFFERKEVKETLNFLRFLLLKDNYSLSLIINIPSRGIGDKTFSKLENEANLKKITIWKGLEKNLINIPKKLQLFIDETKKILEEIPKIESFKYFPNLIEKYLNNIGFFNFYKNFSEEKVKNIQSLIELIAEQFKRKDSLIDDLYDFLKNCALFSSTDTKSLVNNLTLITVHASKGLEFEAVFFVGFNENIIPSNRSIYDSKIEEERRIAYVGITRAKKYLYLAYFYGTDFYMNPWKPSRFIYEFNYPFNLIDQKKDKSFSKFQNYQKNFIKKGYSNDKSNLQAGDIVYHQSFGEGVVIKADDIFVTVAFDKNHGIKEILIEHQFLLKKD